MILMDDNFTTIVTAVKQGRGIYNNIRKTVGFLLGTNIGEVLVVFIAMLLWKETPLLSMQLLWINLVTDSMPAIALGMEKVEPEVMKEKPRSKTAGLFARKLGIQIILQGIMFAVISLLGFYIGMRTTGDIVVARTMTFIIMSISQIVHAFNMRSSDSLFKIGLFTNKKLTLAAGISFVLVLVILCIPPVATAFGLTILTAELYFFATLLSLVPLIVLEIVKILNCIHI